MRDISKCRYYLDYLVAEHGRIHRILRDTYAAIVNSVGPDIGPTFAEVARILGRLRDELELHFTEEESGGCLDEAVSRCPALAFEAKRIEAEHPYILTEVTWLINHANHLKPTVHNQVVMHQAFNRFYRRLQAQERAESKLFSQGFSTNVNSVGNDQPALNLHLNLDSEHLAC